MLNQAIKVMNKLKFSDLVGMDSTEQTNGFFYKDS